MIIYKHRILVDEVGQLYTTSIFDNNRVFIVFAIPTTDSTNNYFLRSSLRRMWMNISYWNSAEFEGIQPDFLKVKLMFIVGRNYRHDFTNELLKEASENNDLFLAKDCAEGREMLKYKVLWAMRRSLELFDYDYFVKVDHDTLIDAPSLIKDLVNLRRTHIYTGAKLRKPRTKILENLKDFSYCQGGGYVLSRDVVREVTLEDPFHVNLPIIAEDIYTGWLVQNVDWKYNRTLHTLTDSKSKVKIYRKSNIHFSYGFWFLHWLKDPDVMDKVFQCRTTTDKLACPDYWFNVTSKACKCS